MTYLAAISDMVCGEKAWRNSGNGSLTGGI